MKKLYTTFFSLLLLIMATTAFAGQDVRFTWDPYTSDPIVGFKLYMASSPNVAITSANLVATIPGQATLTYTQVNVPVGLKYWVLTAYNSTLESPPSNEVNYIVKLKPPSGLGSITTLSFTGRTNILVTNR
jgi:hypothetical protein